MGDQVPSPITGKCPPNGCTPPVDSLFEATWGCTLKDSSKCAVNPSAPAQKLGPATYFDTSQVDGYTLPYKVDFHGDTAHCDCDPQGHCKGTKLVDGSHLSLDECPTSEDLSEGGRFPKFKEVDLRILANSSGTGLEAKVVACMSPCKRLNYGQPFGFNIPEHNEPALHMCCPTPIIGPGCTEAAGCMTPQACRNESDPASVTHSKYVHAIHKMAPGIYSYTYDDGNGLHACPGDVNYTMTFCPPTAPTPPTPSPPPTPPPPTPPPSPPTSPTPAPGPASACGKCTEAQCSGVHCGKANPYTCVGGSAKGGCSGDPAFWPKQRSCTACCDSSACAPGDGWR